MVSSFPLQRGGDIGILAIRLPLYKTVVHSIELFGINLLFCGVQFLTVMNIFVARLNFKTTQETLHQAFSQYGEVASAKIITDKGTGRSKGFGFVEMPNDEEGNKAIAGLNDTEMDGRVIVVKPANPKS